MKFPILLILVIIFASISVGTTYAVLDTFEDVRVTNNLIVDNKLGIGTDSPQGALDVDGKVRIGGGRIQISGFDGSNNFLFKSGGAEPGSAFMTFKTNNDGSANHVKISPGGNIGIFVDTENRVGIAKKFPTEALDVNGNIKLNGDIISNGDICIGTCT